ncbi:protein FAM98B-like [Asparagus officinalis]|uniref:protein FAM98B-like n=1 Tax=Asparagus officinalis TaxID=4686 RepID=UPI00098DF397|nr:protein FAM98B-like [Asparagus officinalis]
MTREGLGLFWRRRREMGAGWGAGGYGEEMQAAWGGQRRRWVQAAMASSGWGRSSGWSRSGGGSGQSGVEGERRGVGAVQVRRRQAAADWTGCGELRRVGGARAPGGGVWVGCSGVGEEDEGAG